MSVKKLIQEAYEQLQRESDKKREVTKLAIKLKRGARMENSFSKEATNKMLDEVIELMQED